MKAKVQMRQYFFKWRTTLFTWFACIGWKRSTGTVFSHYGTPMNCPMFLCFGKLANFTKLFAVKAWALVRETTTERQTEFWSWGLVYGTFSWAGSMKVHILCLWHRWQVHMQRYSHLHGLPGKGWLGNLHGPLISLWLGALWWWGKMGLPTMFLKILMETVTLWRAARSTFITESREGNLIVTEVIYMW